MERKVVLIASKGALVTGGTNLIVTNVEEQAYDPSTNLDLEFYMPGTGEKMTVSEWKVKCEAKEKVKKEKDVKPAILG